MNVKITLQEDPEHPGIEVILRCPSAAEPEVLRILSALRLYELEERFAGEGFVRASKAVVINLDRLRSLRPDFGGRLILTMDNGEKLFASRQYAGYVKKRLGI